MRAKGQGARVRVGGNQIFKLLNQQLVRGYIQASVIVYAKVL
jgi:hypothetical protein